MKPRKPYIVTIRVPVLATNEAQARKLTRAASGNYAIDVSEVRPLTKRNIPKGWGGNDKMLHEDCHDYNLTVRAAFAEVPK